MALPLKAPPNEFRTMTSAEMGAANIVLLAQMQDAKTEKQAQAKWARLQFLLKQQLAILGKPVGRTSTLVSIKKCWMQNGDFYYELQWTSEEEI